MNVDPILNSFNMTLHLFKVTLILLWSSIFAFQRCKVEYSFQLVNVYSLTLASPGPHPLQKQSNIWECSWVSSTQSPPPSSIVWSFIIYLSESFSFVLRRKQHFDRRLQSRWKCLDKGINLSNNSFPDGENAFSKISLTMPPKLIRLSLQRRQSIIFNFVKNILLNNTLRQTQWSCTSI